MVHNTEQAAIDAFHAAFVAGTLTPAAVAAAVAAHPDSLILNYYAGHALADPARKRAAFERCLALEPKFAPPVFELAPLLSKKDAERLLLGIFDVPTLDATAHPPRLRIAAEDILRVCQVLGPTYPPAKARWLYAKAWARLGSLKFSGAPLEVLGRKHLALAYGAECMRAGDPVVAHAVYATGLRLCAVHAEPGIDRGLLQGAAIAAHYVDPAPPPLDSNVTPDALYPLCDAPLFDASEKNKKVRVGYMTPDLNKNAVGLFVTPLLKHYDPRRFEVVVFYTNAKRDAFTAQFQRYPIAEWVECGAMTADDRARAIADRRVDVLVDLLGHGHGGDLEVVARRPAPRVVNYLGFPDRVGHAGYSHRLSDAVADPVADTEQHKSERIVRLPRCFLCYHLFDSVRLPPVRPSTAKSIVFGAVCRPEKMANPALRAAWRRILDRVPGSVLCVKMDDGAQDVPGTAFNFLEDTKDRLVVLPFAATLDGYLDLFNDIDVCLDTFPYSGTTTTCSALVMGVPVVTVYNPGNRHVSNVAGSILAATGLAADHCAADMDAYVELAVARAAVQQKCADREALRARFLEAMDPRRFMADYETTLLSIL